MDSLIHKMPLPFLLPAGYWESIRQQVTACLPEEACGLLAGTAGLVQRIYPITNALHSPLRYRMDSKQQLNAFLDIEKNGWELLGIYHSHPQGPDQPSATDIAEAHYPESIYVIVSPWLDDWQCRAFTIQAGICQPVSLSIEPPDLGKQASDSWTGPL